MTQPEFLPSAPYPPERVPGQGLYKGQHYNVVDSAKSALSIDSSLLKKKYDDERDKRLHVKRSQQQNRALDGDLRYLLDDPFTSAKIAREPLKDCWVDVLVIGGGFGGQQMAVELLKAGISDFRIVEKGGDFGGAWYWNQYPGAQCDIESYIYMPLLEESGYMPTRKFVGGPELLEHARRIGRHFSLYDKASLGTEVKSLHWDDSIARWKACTDRGDTFVSRFVVSALGPLHRPKLPSLPGLEEFQGRSFHTSRWDYSYTGGKPGCDHPQLDELTDKRVGIIGTGATAVQVVPQLAKWAQKLYVFQRTPSSVDVRKNPSTDPVWAASLQPDWQRERMDNFNQILCGLSPAVDLVSDGWTTSVSRFSESKLRNMAGVEGKSLAERKQLLDFEKMEQIRRHVSETVRDPHTAESLKPYYNLFCKRPCWHDEYLQSFNRENVVLVDTHGQGVERVTEKGVVVAADDDNDDNGEEYELDCLILATGFETTTPWWQRSGIEVVGRHGLPLREKWADGPRTCYGLASSAFPNCFFLQTAQSGLSAHFLHVLRHQAEVLTRVIAACRRAGPAAAIEPTQRAEDGWVDKVVESRKARKAFRQQCTPGYYNNDGAQSLVLDRSGTFGGSALEYINILDAWAEKDGFAGFEIHHRGTADQGD